MRSTLFPGTILLNRIQGGKRRGIRNNNSAGCSSRSNDNAHQDIHRLNGKLEIIYEKRLDRNGVGFTHRK